MQYRKKPVVIEAVQWENTGDNLVEVLKFCPTAECFAMMTLMDGKAHFDPMNGVPMLRIPTLEGEHWGQVGDFIIKGIKGEFYPCKPDIFEGSYEPASAEKHETVLVPLAALKGLEWLVEEVNRENDGCPICDGTRKKGHSPGCWIGAALAGVEGSADGNTDKSKS